VNGLRKAALYLHGLEEPDRLWLLNALSQDEREQIQAVIGELQAMKVPSGNAWLPELVEAQAVEQQSAETDVSETQIEAIDRADLAKISQALEDEPDWVVALLLKHRVWSWRQAYISKQYLRKREQLLRALEIPGRSLKPKVEDALLRAFAVRLTWIDAESTAGFEAVMAEAERRESKTTRTSGWSRLWRR
jgi:hypothetical protein